LHQADLSVSTEFGMADVETEMVQISQPMDMGVEDAGNDALLVPLRTLMDIDIVMPQLSALADTASIKIKVQSYTEKVRARKARGPYRRYTAHQLEQLFDYVIEQDKTAKEAALLTGINVRTAQQYIKKYNDDEEKRLPVRCSKPTAGVQVS
jgi:hypothetical protein